MCSRYTAAPITTGHAVAQCGALSHGIVTGCRNSVVHNGGDGSIAWKLCYSRSNNDSIPKTPMALGKSSSVIPIRSI
jgi:hypothetical protein